MPSQRVAFVPALNWSLWLRSPSSCGSVDTIIDSAYHDLQVLGLVRVRPRKDTTVKEDAQGLASRACRENITEWLFQLVQEGKSAGMSKRELTAIFRASLKMDAFPYADIPRSIAKLARYSGPDKHAPTELEGL